MRNILIIFLTSFIFFSCKKDKVPTPFKTNYYQSNGNLMILKIGDDLECVYEYNLSLTALNNDSLPLIIDSFLDGINNYSYWKFSPNPDTIFWYSSNNFSFITSPIGQNELQILNNIMPYDAAEFQLIGNQNNVDYASVWAKISNLDIVKTYRNSFPNSKIGITRIVFSEYDEQLGFNVPIKKHLLFLVK